jgi:hypothetical protein
MASYHEEFHLGRSGGKWSVETGTSPMVIAARPETTRCLQKKVISNLPAPASVNDPARGRRAQVGTPSNPVADRAFGRLFSCSAGC